MTFQELPTDMNTFITVMMFILYGVASIGFWIIFIIVLRVIMGKYFRYKGYNDLFVNHKEDFMLLSDVGTLPECKGVLILMNKHDRKTYVESSRNLYKSLNDLLNSDNAITRDINAGTDIWIRYITNGRRHYKLNAIKQDACRCYIFYRNGHTAYDLSYGDEVAWGQKE